MKESVIYFYQDEDEIVGDTHCGYNHFYICGCCGKKHTHQSINYELSDFYNNIVRETKCDRNKKTRFIVAGTDEQQEIRKQRDASLRNDLMYQIAKE